MDVSRASLRVGASAEGAYASALKGAARDPHPPSCVYVKRIRSRTSRSIFEKGSTARPPDSDLAKTSSTLTIIALTSVSDSSIPRGK